MKVSEKNLKNLIKEAVMSEMAEFEKQQTMADISETKDILENLEIAIENNPDMELLHKLKEDIQNLRQTTQNLKELLDEYEETGY